MVSQKDIPVTEWNSREWDRMYRKVRQESLPWYYEQIDPDILTALEQIDMPGHRLLDIGCGTGNQATALARMGFSVTATDISKTAIDATQALAKDHNVKINAYVEDILTSELEGPFDIILDRGCFHVLAPRYQHIYSRMVKKLLAPYGRLLLKTFSIKQKEDIGPMRLKPSDINRIFGDLFSIESVHSTIFQGTLSPEPRALFCVMVNR